MRAPEFIRPGTGAVPEEKLRRELDRWTGAALITKAQAEAIRTFEEAHAPPRRRVSPVPEPRVPLIAEAIGYVGAALVVGAGLAVTAQTWDQLAPGLRLALTGVAAALFLAAGWSLRRSHEPALARLADVLWCVSVAATAWFLWILSHDVAAGLADYAVLIAGIGATFLAWTLFQFRTRSMEQAALLGASILTVAGIVAAADRAGWETFHRHPGIWTGGLVTALGIAWVLAGWRSVLRPVWTALALGSLTGLVGPMVMSEKGPGSNLLLGLAVSAAFLAGSVALRQTVLLRSGAAGLFVYTLWTIGYYFSESLGWPLALLLSGVALLAIALLTVRLRPLVRHPERRPNSPRAEEHRRLPSDEPRALA